MKEHLNLASMEFYLPFIFRGVRFCLALLVTLLATMLVSRLLSRVGRYSRQMMEKHGGNTDFETEKRVTTIMRMFRRVIVSLLWSAGILVALEELNFNVAPLLAGAGIVGLAIGFGAQSLVKDVLNGALLLIENQIRVNDVAVINGTGGLVEEINLRTTVLRSENGAVHIFPNGSIQTLTNLTREYSYYVLEIPVPYQADTDRVIAAWRHVAEEVSAEPEYRDVILAPLEVMGVDRFADTGAVIKARIKTRAMKQWTVGRELNRRIKKELEAAGIPAPFSMPRMVLDGALFSVGAREELKRVIREVLAESQAGQH